MFRRAQGEDRPGVRSPDRLVIGLLALCAYLPMLWTSPGRVSADTKSYLTLDPVRLLERATSMWDPLTGAGTVPHQNIGYLFPLGPYYWLMDTLSVPDWIAQRLVWGTLVFAAATGAYRLARWLGWSAGGAAVVAAAFGFSPYLLSYLARLSVILGPWAALPWMILLAAKAARTRSWRPAAWFAVVVMLVGSVNATALVLAGLGPVLWLACDVAAGRVGWRMAGWAAVRIGVLSAAVSLWWIVALRVQGAYGIPILRYTETYEAVAGASMPAELLRGLGYWFFYGSDRLDPWVGPAVPYVDSVWLIGLGFALAGASLLGLLWRFSGRASLIALLVVGLGVSVGAAPLGDSSPYGRLFEWLATNSTAGMALRSTPRAAPLVLLALAFGLGAASEWLRAEVRRRRWVSPRWDLAVPLVVIAVVFVQLFPWFTGRAATESLLRDEALPAHVTELAAWLDSDANPESAIGDRVYELPAADFAYHRWGGTVDPALPGVIDRPYLARELVPQGGPATTDLLDAFERRIPEGWFEPEGLRAFAELFAVETVVVRNDLEHERLRLARPGQLWTDLGTALGDPSHTGPVVTDTPRIPILDEVTLAHPEAASEFPVAAGFEIGAGDAVRTAPADDPMIVSGSGDGVVDLAGAGLLDPRRALLYAASLDDLAARDALPDGALGTSPWWVFTDTNRKEGRHWSGVSANRGALEPEGEIRLEDDPADQRLDVFPENTEQQTRAVHLADVDDVRATYYGNRIAYTPEDAPWFAIDGDPRTAWRGAVFGDAREMVWEADLAAPVAPGEVTVLQPITGVTSRFITRIAVVLDGDTSFEVDLDGSSLTEPGQVVDLPDVEFSQLRIEVLADNIGPLANYTGQPGIGFAEVVIPGVVDDRLVDVPGPSDFPALDIGDIDSDRLTYVLTRQRIDPATSNRTAPEPAMSRRVEVPTDRPFTISGEVRLAADASDETLSTVLDESAAAVANRRLPGSPASRGQSAFDGDPTTAWRTPFGDATGAIVTVPAEWEQSPDELLVSWLDDGRHSPPAGLLLHLADGSTESLAVMATAPVDGIATSTLARSSTAAIESIEVVAVDPRTSPEYYSGVDLVLPTAIVEFGSGEATSPVTGGETLSGECRDDIVTLDGHPLSVRISGSRDEALARGELTLEGCDEIEMSAGTHRIDVIAGGETGFDVDRLVLDAAAAGEPSAPSPAPETALGRAEATAVDVSVAPSEDSAWLVLRQSWNAGWTATLDGSDLGEPVLIDGYANGWLLPASDVERTVELRWTPQRTVTIALWLSLLAGVGVVVLAVVSRRREIPLHDPEAAAPPSPSIGLAAVAATLAVVLVAFSGIVVAAASLVVGFLASRPHARQRLLAPLAVLVTGAVVAGGIMALEWRRDLPVEPRWPSEFAWSAPLTWFVVGVVACTAAFDSARRRRPPHPAVTPDPNA